MKTSLALIGFMASGKSAVGRALARRLYKKYIELDALVKQRAGKPIADIFKDDGEIAFRQLEIELIKEISPKKNQVIACGGGIVLNKINIDRLKEEAVIVYLKASAEVILERALKGGTVRPLLKGDNKQETIGRLLKFRQPYYERAADITIDTSALDIKAITEQIVVRLKQDADFH